MTWQAFRLEAKTFLHHFLIPAMTVFLPARAGLRWLNFWASLLALRSSSSDWEIANLYLPEAVGDRRRFLQRAKTYALLDWADVYLARTRASAAWMKKNIVMQGDPPPKTAAMAITIHYGAGLWSLPLLSQHWPLGWVFAPIVYPPARGEWLHTKLSEQRLSAIRRMPRVSLLSTPGAYQKMQDCTTAGGGIVGLIDAPDIHHRAVAPISVFGHEWLIANGLVRFAQSTGLPIYLYTVSLSPAGTQRIFRGQLLETSGDIDDSMHKIGQWMAQEIAQDPAAWHLWRFVKQFQKH